MDKKLKFFIVDDDPDIIKILAKFLKTEGFIVSHSTSSVSALPEIIQQKPDCVLLDIMMPEMDGLELCKQLRSDRGLDVMKIVMVSAKAYESDRKRAISFGADGYIIKPVKRQKFIDQLQRIIEGQI